ncbi:MAG: hypothetical protein EOO75_11755, partial [Myxococcales bacterium]
MTFLARASWTLTALLLAACGPTSQGPTEIAGVTGVQALAIGVEQTCALLAGGQVVCLGGNSRGQLGIGSTSSRVTTPSPVLEGTAPLGGVERVAAFGATSCARQGADAWVCWGEDPLGVLGLSDPTRASAVAFLRGASSMTLVRGVLHLVYP